jgi:uncharacterized protein YndB with AHSA1/START domain
MKWILYALAAVGALLVVCVIVLLAMGGGRGESQLQATVDIARPPEVVFTFITEPARVKSWLGWLVEIRSLTPGKQGVGAREVWVMEDRNNNNQHMDIRTEVTRYDPARSYEARLEATEGFTGTVLYELQPVDGNATRLIYRGQYQFHHWFARLLSPVITRAAQQKLDEDMARLKQQVEAA